MDIQILQEWIFFFTLILQLQIATDFDEEFPKATEESKEQLLHANMNVLAQILFMWLGLSNYLIDGVLRNDWLLPVPAWYPFDTTEPLGYVVALLTQLVGGIETAVLLSVCFIRRTMTYVSWIN